jgi:hypothetical protein
MGNVGSINIRFPKSCHFGTPTKPKIASLDGLIDNLQRIETKNRILTPKPLLSLLLLKVMDTYSVLEGQIILTEATVNIPVSSLNRKELQAMAMANGIKANGKSIDIINSLTALNLVHIRKSEVIASVGISNDETIVDNIDFRIRRRGKTVAYLSLSTPNKNIPALTNYLGIFEDLIQDLQ